MPTATVIFFPVYLGTTDFHVTCSIDTNSRMTCSTDTDFEN